MDEFEEPRIIARGQWTLNEFGDTTYIPAHIRPIQPNDEDGGPADPDWDADDDVPPAFAAERLPEAWPHRSRTGDGYHVRSDDTWAAAQRDYLAGDTAEAVCARYDLKIGTLRHRAGREGWRRRDAPDPAPFELDPDSPPPDLAEMARHALARLNHAVSLGRATEAASWLRTWRALTEEPHRPAPRPAPIPEPEPDPDPVDLALSDLKEVEAIAEAIAAMDIDDPAARAVIEARVAAVTARSVARTASHRAASDDPDSDDSD